MILLEKAAYKVIGHKRTGRHDDFIRSQHELFENYFNVDQHYQQQQSIRMHIDHI